VWFSVAISVLMCCYSCFFVIISCTLGLHTLCASHALQSMSGHSQKTEDKWKSGKNLTEKWTDRHS